jgi:predicted MFS family arabinose efflux permease
MDTRLVWLALAAFVGSIEGGGIAGLLPSISEDMGVSMGQAGQVVLGYSLGYAIGAPVLAVLLGGVGRRRVLGWSEFGVAICALLIALAPAFGWLIGARALLSIAVGTFTGTAMSVAAALAPPGQRGRGLQVIAIGQSIAALVGVPASSFIAVQFSWRIDYAIIAALAGAAALALYVKLPRGMHGDTQTIRERVRVMGNKGIPSALLVVLVLMVALHPSLIYVGALMADTGIGREALPLALFANGLGAIAASLSGGRLADRFGSRRTVTLAMLALLAPLGGLAALTLLPQEMRFAVLFAALVLMGYVGWVVWLAHCSHMAHLAPSSVPVALSLDLTAFNIGIATAALAGGADLAGDDAASADGASGRTGGCAGGRGAGLNRRVGILFQL